MPSQRVAYMKKKSQEEFEQLQMNNNHSKQRSSVPLSITVAGGANSTSESQPQFTRTGLMLTQSDPFAKEGKHVKQKKQRVGSGINDSFVSKH